MSRNREEEAFDAFFRKLNNQQQLAEKGKILLSEPFLSDPNFSRSVVLLVRHDPEGSVGFVLNRESDFYINEVVDDFPDFESRVFIGGPVGRESLFYLHSLGDKLEGSFKVQRNLYWGGNFDLLKELIDKGEVDPKQIRFFVGYSGWESGQLEQEMEEKSWIVTKAASSEVLIKNTGRLWGRLLNKLGDSYRIISNFPKDPHLN
ncbi:YqgE/AlgH family protein [bacterium SCSIO 12741]|nr:YqgE/AlgH family protein [bacterium SCSIO 12741]